MRRLPVGESGWALREDFYVLGRCLLSHVSHFRHYQSDVWDEVVREAQEGDRQGGRAERRRGTIQAQFRRGRRFGIAVVKGQVVRALLLPESEWEAVASVHADWLEENGHAEAAAALRKAFAAGRAV